MATDNFNTAAAEPQMVDAETYYNLLTKLVKEGEGFGKTENVGAFLMRDIRVQTETIKGEVETTKDIAVEKLYVVMDLSQYPLPQVRNLVVEDMAKKWGTKVVTSKDLESPDFKGAGIWTLAQKKFDVDYVNDSGSVFKPDPNATRLCVDLDTDVKFPVTWGEFTVKAGGALAVRERDVPALLEALASVRSGDKTAAEALLTKDDKNNTISVFDVYGMEPYFLKGDGAARKANYGVVALKQDTTEQLAAFKGPTGGTNNRNRAYTS